MATPTDSDDGKDKTFAKGGELDISKGPLKKRWCTDIPCTVIFVLHFIVFFVVVFAGIQDGDPRKLYRPRDYKGQYCGIGSSLGNYDFKMQMMNVSAIVDPIAKEFVCSTVARTELESLLTSAQLSQYLCACCLIPCSSCQGSLDMDDFASSSAATTRLSTRMLELTDTSQASTLFSASSTNMVSFSAEDIWSQATKYFIPVCVSESCAIVNSSTTSMRNYTFTPTPDAEWKTAWDTLSSSITFASAISSSFTFQAMPLSRCPYDAALCVQFPGIEFGDGPGDYCIPKLTPAVTEAIGSTAATALESLGAISFSDASDSDFGAVMGEALRTISALCITAFWSFMIGLLFLVLLRFLVGCIMWSSLFLVFALLFAGGSAAYLRSAQCADSSLFETGTTAALAVTISAQTAVTNALTGESVSEAMTGIGTDYRGRQMRTRSGRHCQKWSVQSPHTHIYTPANFSNADLSENYCRNPATAYTIWCYTTDSEKPWEVCSPIGVVQPECRNGYEIQMEEMRDALKICAYIIWSLAGLWAIAVIFMWKRIRLAIAINKVAAMFVYHTPTILMVPIVQILVAFLWCLLWGFLVAFLLSQVPTTYVPSESFATHNDAYVCSDKWPTGFIWKDLGDVTAVDDPCSGNMGDTTEITPKCFRCGLPRYVLDYRFAYTFFTFLWNNAFLIAMGQCTVAVACGTWFFTKRELKGSKSYVANAVWTVLRYHLGTLAFGSFILAVVQFIRYVMKYFEKQAEAQNNRVMVIVLKVVQCCIWCFEKCIKFLNKNAYIQTALCGTNFCTSAKNAFWLIFRNMVRFGTLALLGGVIRVLGFAVISVATTICGYFILQALHPDASPVVPVLCYFAVGYLVSKLYMNVFGLAVDTCLQCFIICEEMQEAGDFVPGPLKSLVKHRGGAHNKVTPE